MPVAYQLYDLRQTVQGLLLMGIKGFDETKAHAMTSGQKGLWKWQLSFPGEGFGSA
jgi:hypothetical protein